MVASHRLLYDAWDGMGEAAARTLTYGEYLALSASEEGLFEFHDGTAVLMVAPSTEHARIAGRLVELLRASLGERPCTALPSGLKVRVEATNRTLLPDVTVVCGPLARSTIDPQAITNPIVIVEVLSKATEDYDQGPKFHQYRRLATLREYVVVAQDRRSVSIARRAGDLWSFEDLSGQATLRLSSLDIELSLDAIYCDALGNIVD